MNTSFEHKPVLLDAVLEGLNIVPSGIYVDATFGRGGHAKAILARLNDKGRLLVLDRDLEALSEAKKLANTDARVSFYHGSFKALKTFCDKEGVLGQVDGILFDLGVSSPQLDNPKRGFSFQKNGPLDMRMDQTQPFSALEWVNSSDEADISHVLKTLGEERFHRRIAKAIVEARAIEPIAMTEQLVEIIKKATPVFERGKHPATRSFQAIRMWVNQELEEIDCGLNTALDVLKAGGRLVAISFHSLEDRLVKRFIQTHEKGDRYPIGLPIMHHQIVSKMRRVGRSIRATENEQRDNPRSRSATLRIAEKGDFL